MQVERVARPLRKLDILIITPELTPADITIKDQKQPAQSSVSTPYFMTTHLKLLKCKGTLNEILIIISVDAQE